jgi:nucleoside-diphosphate-sugar epimerase
MHVLVIGGNRFMGVSLVWRLLFAGHRVTVCNRGNLADPFGDRVERVRADRSTDAFDAALAGRAFDRVIDMAGFTGDDVARALRVLGDRVGHYLFVSTGQVYLVREGCPRPAREDDYAGPVMAAAPSPADHEDWAYGVGKRAAEDALAAAAVPSTRVRIPMVNGERDPKRRLESYLWRMLDGGPLLVPGADAIARHVYRGAVVDALARMVDAPPPGPVYNLAQAEQPTVRELLERLGAQVGVRPRIVDVPAAEIAAAGLAAREVSPLSTTWMSHVDPARAVAELGFAHPPLDAYLGSIVAELLTGWRAEPPAGYAQRARELSLAA